MRDESGVRQSRPHGRRLRAIATLLRVMSMAWLWGAMPILIIFIMARFDAFGLLELMAWIIGVIMVTVMLVAALFLGFVLDKRGQQHQALSAAAALAGDRRLPILYFRSFSDEPRTRRIRSGTRANVYYNYSFSEEEYLRDEILKVGPFVAIGRPGDPLPQLGANRLYVDDSDWQSAVSRLLDEAAGVVIRVGRGGGLSWEIRQALLRIPPERLLFVVPRHRYEYGLFKAEVNPLLPRPLPPYPDVEPKSWFHRVPGQIGFQLLGFLYFASDWSASLELFYFRRDEPSHKVIRREFSRCLERFLLQVAQTRGPTGNQGSSRRQEMRRFNPPPNWPPPPTGWMPPPGWQPHPSWPPPPENWQFWIDDPMRAPPETADEPPPGPGGPLPT